VYDDQDDLNVRGGSGGAGGAHATAGGGGEVGVNAGGAAASSAPGLFFNDGKDGPQTAAGRISLRIELPQEGERYYFAALGAKGGVTLDATEQGGRVGRILLGLALAVLAVLAYRWRPVGNR
jgi:hypothetical protein